MAVRILGGRLDGDYRGRRRIVEPAIEQAFGRGVARTGRQDDVAVDGVVES